MKRGQIASVLGMVALTGFSFTALAEIKENPYQVIIDRNPFGLRPIPPPPEPKKEEPPPVPAPDVKLTGITTLLGAPRVMLQVEDKQGKDPAKKFSFPTIAEGDSDPATGIAVLSIDVENQRVRIKNGEAEMMLDFKNNGIKASAGGIASIAPVPHPGLPGVVPLAPPGVPQPFPGAPAASTTAGRSAIVSGGAQAATLPNAAFPGGLPARPVRSDNLSIVAGGGGQVYNANPQPLIAQQPALTKDEAEARIEAARRMLEQQGSSQSKILPPTSLGRALGLPQPDAPAIPAPTRR